VELEYSVHPLKVVVDNIVQVYNKLFDPTAIITLLFKDDIFKIFTVCDILELGILIQLLVEVGGDVIVYNKLVSVPTIIVLFKDVMLIILIDEVVSNVHPVIVLFEFNVVIYKL
jgi:hypothetical protein